MTHAIINLFVLVVILSIPFRANLLVFSLFHQTLFKKIQICTFLTSHFYFSYVNFLCCDLLITYIFINPNLQSPCIFYVLFMFILFVLRLVLILMIYCIICSFYIFI